MYSKRQKKLCPMLRFDFLRFINQATVRTFNKNIYKIKTGLILQDTVTKELKRLNDVYYDIRTVRDIKGNVIAKRKNPNSDLFVVKENSYTL